MRGKAGQGTLGVQDSGHVTTDVQQKRCFQDSQLPVSQHLLPTGVQDPSSGNPQQSGTPVLTELVLI